MAETGNLSIENTPLGTPYEMISTFCVQSEGQRVHSTLWAAASHVYKLFPAFARLDFSAEGPGHGKSVNLEVITSLCPNPLTVAYSTENSIKNWLDEHPETTLGLDERDGIFGPMGRNITMRKELIAMLNAGYAQNGKVLSTRNGRAVLIHVYNAIAHAGIGRAPAALLDRSITINLRKAAPLMNWVPVLHEQTLFRIGSDLGTWLSDPESRNFLVRQPTSADIPGDPRHRLIMAPLAAVAQLAGCYNQFLEAENEVTTGIQSHPLPSRSEMLLRDLSAAILLDGRDAFRMISLHDIREILRDSGASQWTDKIEPGPLGDVELRSLLREQGLESTTSNGQRGYHADDILSCARGKDQTEQSSGSERRTENGEQPSPGPAAGHELAELAASFGGTPDNGT
jgi:hypothetical protein